MNTILQVASIGTNTIYNITNSQFINKYSQLIFGLDCINYVGKPSFKLNKFILFAIISLFLFIFIYIFKYNNYTKKNKNNKKKKSFWDKIKILIINLILLLNIIFIIFCVYKYTNLYVNCYDKDYKKWFLKLKNTRDGLNDFNKLNNYREINDIVNDTYDNDNVLSF